MRSTEAIGRDITIPLSVIMSSEAAARETLTNRILGSCREWFYQTVLTFCQHRCYLQICSLLTDVLQPNAMPPAYHIAYPPILLVDDINIIGTDVAVSSHG